MIKDRTVKQYNPIRISRFKDRDNGHEKGKNGRTKINETFPGSQRGDPNY